MKQIKVYVAYGNKKDIDRLMFALIAMEQPFHYSGEYVYFNYDPTGFIKNNCSELELTIAEELWFNNCLNFKEA